MRLTVLRRLAMLGLLILLVFAACACGTTGASSKDPPEPSAEVSAEVTQTQFPEATDPPIEITGPPPTEKPYTEDELFFVWYEGTKYRSLPVSEEINVLGMLSVGTKVLCLEDHDEFMLVELEDGQQVWVARWYLTAENEAVAEQMAETALNICTQRESFQPIAGKTVYQSIANLLNCRAKPELTATILCQIALGTRLEVLGIDNGFYLCRLPGGKLCYCSTDWVTDELTYVTYPGAVDLRVYLPEAVFELPFTSTGNVTGKAMYPATPLLESGTAYMLYQAYEAFLADGYILKIYDAYRPLSAQIKLYEIVQDSRFIADPNFGGSWHQRGRAVDISLIDMATGKELEMPTLMHTFSMDAARVSSNQWTDEARKNVDYMTQVMKAAGFDTIDTEWWHFEYTGFGQYLPKDINLYSLTQYPVTG